MRETWPNLPKVKAERMDGRIKIYSTRGVSLLFYSQKKFSSKASYYKLVFFNTKTFNKERSEYKNILCKMNCLTLLFWIKKNQHDL